MKRITVVACALGLATATYAFAEPVKMSEAQLDQVAGGLADVSVNVNPSNVANPTVNPAVTVNPSVQVHVLGG